MATVRKGVTFESLVDRDSGRLLENLEFQKCTFDNCHFSNTIDPAKRSTARNLRFHSCTVVHSTIQGGIIEDVLIEHLKTKPMLHVWGAVFCRVVLQGKIDRLMISPRLRSATGPKEAELLFSRKNKEYYKHVDWALDISAAEFVECDIRGVPSELIKRDADTQMVLTRERALNTDWARCGVDNSAYFSVISDIMTESNLSDTVIVAAKRSRTFKSIASDLKRLKQQGVVR